MTGPRTSPDRLRRQRARAAARRRRCPPAWPEAGREATPRGRRRAASAQRPSRARARGRNRPRRPVRGRARVPASRAAARLGRIQRSRDFPPRRSRRILARIRRSWCPPPSILRPRSDRATGACHMIVAPPVARVAAEHGLADWRSGPGAWRASRRRRYARGAGAGPGSAPAPQAPRRSASHGWESGCGLAWPARQVVRRARERWRCCQSGKGTAANRGGSGWWPVWSARIYRARRRVSGPGRRTV